MAPSTQPPTIPLGIPTRQDILDLENDSFENKGQIHGQPQRFEKDYRTQLSTTAASVASLMVSYPLDTCKSKMQVHEFKGFLNCVRQTHREHGFKEFYRGVSAPLCTQTMVRIVSMTTYQKAKYAYSEWFYRNYGLDPLVSANTPGEYPGLITLACFSGAGATAGFWSTFVSCPFELTSRAAQLANMMAKATEKAARKAAEMAAAEAAEMEKRGGKVRASRIETSQGMRHSSKMGKKQLSMSPTNAKLNSVLAAEKSIANSIAPSRVGDYTNKGVLKIAHTIVKNRGIMGLYTGFRIQLLRDTIGTAIYFATYETTKQALNAYRGDSSPSSPLTVLFASSLCGITSWALIYPIDVAKTIYQQNSLMRPKGEVVPMPKIVFFKRSMYRGLGVSIGKSVVTAAAFFSVFEAMKKRINALEDYDLD